MKLEKIDKNKKRITMIAILLTTFMVPQVKAITSDNVLYGEGNVTEALDELNENLNICLSGDADETKILSGYQTYYKGKLVVGTIPSKSSATYTPGTSNQTIAANQWLSGAQTIKGDSNLKASNIACGVTIFGVTGTKDCAPSTILSGLYSTAKIGDYVQMTPTSTSYTIPSSLTGYTSAQTINPSELKLWRIIRINDDGTIEMVSEYVSSTVVYFAGEAGYKNFVGALNTIAAQYANSNYTMSTRHIGYNNQTATITATLSASTCNISTIDNSKETSGCGDVSYQRDTNLVRSVYGNLKANKVAATTTATEYWLASRVLEVVFSSGAHRYGGRTLNTYGVEVYKPLYASDLFLTGSGDAIRPIVTLKSGIVAASGSGTKSKPWILS